MSQKIKVNNIHNGNPGLSGWYAILPEPEPPQVLTEDINAEWIIIGGGFSGLSAARRLLQLNGKQRIVLLDSIRIGEGSAGRNSGFMVDLPHDISKDSYAGSVEQDICQTKKNRYALSFAAEAAEEYGGELSPTPSHAAPGGGASPGPHPPLRPPPRAGEARHTGTRVPGFGGPDPGTAGRKGNRTCGGCL